MGTRTIILVRHGQYHPAKENSLEKLTKLGRSQAKYTAKRLKENNIGRIIHSSMPRAVETANIIKSGTGFKQTLLSCDSLRECVPGFPKKLRKKHGFTDEKMLKKHQAQAERAFRKYFKKSNEDTVDILVCHGNIIRYLICKVMDIDTLKWRQMDILQCGISVVQIKSRGNQRKLLISHNDIGHIPKKKRTFL